jgi:hypothetical protein
MKKRTRLILLFMLVSYGVLSLGITQAGAQSTTLITGASFDGGKLVTSLSGQTPIDPCYNPNPSDPNSPCLPMCEGTALYICNGSPILDSQNNPQNCRQYNFSTLGVAYNTYVCWGGRLYYIAP